MVAQHQSEEVVGEEEKAEEVLDKSPEPVVDEVVIGDQCAEDEPKEVKEEEEEKQTPDDSLQTEEIREEEEKVKDEGEKEGAESKPTNDEVDAGDTDEAEVTQHHENEEVVEE